MWKILQCVFPSSLDWIGFFTRVFPANHPLQSYFIYIYSFLSIYIYLYSLYMYIYIYSYITTYIYIAIYIYYIYIHILYISLGEVPRFARFSLSRQIKPFPPSATPSSWPPPLTARATPPKPQPDAKFARSVRARFAPWGSEEKLRCSMN